MSNNISRMVRNAMTMMAGTLASRILGLIREIITAAIFGASRSLDAFYVAYTLANLARQLLAEGALSAAFVPIFARALDEKGADRARDLAKQASGALIGACFVVVSLGIVFTPWLVNLMAPGFDGEKAELAIKLTRWLFPFLMMVSLAALAMGVLNSMDRFFVPAVAPALSNLAYIMVVVLFASRADVGLLVWAVMIGGFLQMALQLFAAYREGFPLVPSLPKKDDPELKKMILLFLPYAAGLSLNQVNPVISRVMGSFLQDGAISVLTYANRVIQLPLGLIVIAISQAVLPELSRCVVQGNDTFRDTVRDSVRFALFAILPITLGACMVSGPVINVLFYRGAFDQWAWKATSEALFMYALGLPGMACSTVIMRALYAKGLSRSAVMVTLSSVIFNLILSYSMMKWIGFSGLALAPSVAFTISAVVGIYLLSLRLGGAIGLFGFSWVSKMAISGVLLFLSVRAFELLWPFPLQASLATRSVWIGLIFISGMTSYGIITYALRCGEWEWIKGAFKGKRKSR
nr:murein biosynthesis integral membrane protein MurJ [uncultured Dethiosulfovibrio sp.]